MSISPTPANSEAIETIAKSIDVDVNVDTTETEAPFIDTKTTSADAKNTAPADAKNTAPSEKLQKLLARMGLGSRRQMEQVIKSARVTINGAVATTGDRVIGGDEIRVDGRLVKYKAEKEKRRRVLAYYKPEGEICSANDPGGRTTVFERLPKLTGDRWVMVGRLDINSSGLLLFTNDGELAHRLMHPSNEITREYAARILGDVTPQICRNLTDGVTLEDGLASFESIRLGGGEGVNKWYHVSLKEGRNREVRRLFESQGLRVSRLLRTHYGSMKLPTELRTGRLVELDHKDIRGLTDLVSLRPRFETGVTGKLKERQERAKKRPMKARMEDRYGHIKNKSKDSKEDIRFKKDNRKESDRSRRR